MKKNGKKLIATGLLAAIVLTAFGCQRKPESYSHTDFAMGTVTNVTLYGTDDSLDKIEQNLIAKVKEVENEQISWRIKDSQLAKINAALPKKGEAVVKEPLKGWLENALKISHDSMLSKDEGATWQTTVDPSIGQLTQLWDFESENPKVPSETSIHQIVKEQGGIFDNSEHVIIGEDGTIKACSYEKTKFDLGAFGKGIGTDEIKKLLKEEKEITGAMAALGGSIYVYGEKPDKTSWNVGIQDPSGQDGEMLGSIKVKGDTFISTSGDYEKYFVDEKTGKKYFHILDSKTGYPVETDITSCTIVCDSGICSDGLSTACFALGVEKSRELLKKYHAKAVFVDKKKNVYVSDGLDFTLQKDGYKVVKESED